MKAAQIIEQALDILFDTDETQWRASELLRHLNQAQAEVVRAKPDAFVKREIITLVAGQKQSLPSDGIVLVDVVRCLGLTGTATAVTPVQRHTIDRVSPEWQKLTASIKVVHYMHDTRDRKHFDVYPRQPETPGQVEVEYGAIPPELINAQDDLTLSADYYGALLDYVLYRAHLKSCNGASPAQGAAHLQAFYRGLGIQDVGEKMNQAGRPKAAEIR